MAPVTNAGEWTVSELSGALKRTLEDAFGHVRLRGEISGYRGPHASGHAYFCLKDQDARLDAVIWKTTFGRLRFKPQEGLEVVATGRITTFPGKSTYQIVVESLEPAGAGALMALLDERRRTLAAEGLFAEARKRRPPFLPRVIGIVTSPTGSVIRDILHRLDDRFPRPVLVWPVRVQGETCAAEVAAAIRGFNVLAPGGPIRRPDVLIVARGGGSLEDLWSFNEEVVVRAAAESAIPLIAAIGHETDWTLIDHAADLRAPTPTGAAEMAVPVRSELVAQIGGLARRHAEAAGRTLDARRSELRSAARALPGAEGLVGAPRQRVDLAAAKLGPALLANARAHEAGLRRCGDKLAKHSPRMQLVQVRTRFGSIADRPLAALSRAAAAERARLAEFGARLERGRERVVMAEEQRIAACRAKAGELGRQLRRGAESGVAARRERVGGLGNLLVSLSYRSVLERGYALVRHADGRPAPRAAALGAGGPVTIEFADGTRQAEVDGDAPAVARRDASPKKSRPAALVQPNLFDI